MEDTGEDDEDHVDSGVVTKLVSHKTNNGRPSEHSKWENGVYHGHINITDANVFHVDGQVWYDGISSSSKHKQSHFQWQQFLVNLKHFDF